MTMVDLEQFPADIYQTLIALPYRVGLFVSASDSTGGPASEAKELAALENVVTFYVEDTLKSEFAQSIMLVTLQHKAYWKDWGSDIKSVPNECRDMMAYLEDRVESRNVLAFKGNLLEIAMAVALAYRETESETGFFAKIKRLFSPIKIETVHSNNSHLNISVAEKAAINELAEIFGIPHKVE